MSLRRSLLAVMLVAAVGFPAGALATVPPRTCGPLKVGSRNYIVKADQIRCSSAMAGAKAYLVSHRKPAGYTCRNFTGSKMTFRCNRGIKVFFAIRH